MGDKIIPLAISSIGGTHEKTMLEVDVFSKIDVKEKTYLLKEITNIFRLKDDLGGLYNFMDRDKILRRVKNELYGLRPPGIGASVFEGAIRIIIQQQISLQVAYVMTGALVKRFGKRIEINGDTFYDFPSPEKLATTSESELRNCKLSRQKAKYIKELAAEVTDGYDLEGIKRLDDEEAIKELMKFKGIGMWSAELILITTLGRMNLCVPDDLGSRKSVSHFYFDGQLQSGDVVREFTEKWGEFKGWIIYYLICAYNMEMERVLKK